MHKAVGDDGILRRSWHKKKLAVFLHLLAGSIVGRRSLLGSPPPFLLIGGTGWTDPELASIYWLLQCLYAAVCGQASALEPCRDALYSSMCPVQFHCHESVHFALSAG